MSTRHNIDLDPFVDVKTRVRESMLAAIDEDRGEETRSAWIREAFETYLNDSKITARAK